jgi:asparagine synthase (glutamine-hydrolysing)
VTVLLDGHDGDTAVGHGLGRLSELARRGRWLKLLRETRALSEHFAAFDRPLSRAWEYIRRDALAPALRTLHLRRALRPAQRPRGLIAEELARRVGFEERRTVPPRPRDADEEHRRHFDQGLIGLGLELSERVAAAQGIEARHPFFDRRVVEYCATLPSQKKLSNGWTRLVMREGMDGILPPDVQWRGGKADLGPNFSRSLLRLDGAELARTVADRETLAGIVDPVKLSRLHARVLEKPETPGARELWKVASLRAWLLRRGYAHGSPSKRTNPASPRS